MVVLQKREETGNPKINHMQIRNFVPFIYILALVKKCDICTQNRDDMFENGSSIYKYCTS